MRGEFIGVWSETRREIWQPLTDQPLGETGEGFVRFSVGLEDADDLTADLAQALDRVP